MPHYTDGTPAQVGDLVEGISYNLQGRRIVGTLISVTPGTESCNCVVAFIKVEKLPPIPEGFPSWTALADKLNVRIPVLYYTAVDSEGKTTAVIPSAQIDYGETKAFNLIYRPDSDK